MRVVTTAVPGLVLVEPTVYRDTRGAFLETFHQSRYAAAGLPGVFVQDNQSSSVRHTLRGLHMQVRNPQGKLVWVVEGEIWDVAVDVRLGSPTFGKWIAETLSADSFKQMYIPPGCAHGFCVLSESATVHYKCTELYDPADEVGIAYDDPTLKIAWPIEHPILSDRDRRHPRLTELMAQLQWDDVSKPRGARSLSVKATE
jgi:dTDP-4-dehydrorhamnose 3,5-epimerase